MSGEAVGFPLVPAALLSGVAVVGAGVVVAAVVVPGSLAARAIRSFVDGRVAAAQREVEVAKAQMEDWQRGVAAQARLQAEELRRLEAFHEAVGRLSLTEIREPSAKERATASDVPGLLVAPGTAEEREIIGSALAQIGAVFMSLEKMLAGREDSPLPLLRDHKRKFEEQIERGDRVFVQEVTTFRSMVFATLKDFQESEERRAAHRAQLMTRVEKILDDALRIRELAAGGPLRAEAEPVLNELRLMPGTDRLSASRLDTLETLLADLKKRAEAALEESAARRVLEESVTRHLVEFGYRVLQDFSAGTVGEPRRARLSVPGGEQVWITLQENGALAFRLVHEDQREVSGAEHFLPEFKRQEAKWCADLKRLFSCLAGDGFPYEIRFERSVPEGGIQVVYVEDGAGWETEQFRKASSPRAKAKTKQQRAQE